MPTTPDDERINWRSSIPFLSFHLIPLLMIWTGVTLTSVVLAATFYFVRIFFITAGYHRYFSHRSYRLGRVAQFLMALGGTTAMQKGPLWWAAHHRHHHRWSDTELDVHSPIKGFWWSHVGWILSDKHKGTDLDRVKDLAKYPELVWLERHDWVGGAGLAVLAFLIDGWTGVVVGFGVSTILVWHGTFTVNSLAHVFGRRRYVTTDTSRNSWIIALITNGEGWHNNHHHYQASARQGFRWYEWDPSYYALWLLSKVGIVRDLKAPTPQILTTNLVSPEEFDVGMFRARWQRASARLVAAGAHAGDALAERRHQLEAAIDAARHDIDERIAAQRHALDELAMLCHSARLRLAPIRS